MEWGVTEIILFYGFMVVKSYSSPSFSFLLSLFLLFFSVCMCVCAYIFSSKNVYFYFSIVTQIINVICRKFKNKKWKLPHQSYTNVINGTLLSKFKKFLCWHSRCGAAETSLARNHEVAGSIPGLAQWVKYSALPWAAA